MYEDILSQNPYLMYQILKSEQGKHFFNQQIGYNPYFGGDYQNDYDVFGNVNYLSPQYANYNFGLKDLILTSLGFHRALGYNNIDASLAAAQQHALAKDNAELAFEQFGLSLGSLLLPGWWGLPVGFAIDAGYEKYKEHRNETLKLMQRANILTSHMITNGNFDTGLSSKEIKDIERYSRKLAVDDEFFSANDLMDMMNKFNKAGMLNDITSSTEFKQMMRVLKNRVKDLAEFLDESNPSKLFQDLARYRFLGFSKEQAFDVMKSMKIASNLSGMNMQTLERLIGMNATGENPIGIDTRLLTRQGISIANTLNPLQRLPGFNFFSNNQQALNLLIRANTKAEAALSEYYNEDSNKDVFLAKRYAMDHNISFQEAYDKITKMSYQERNKIVEEYAKDDSFAKVYFNPQMLSAAVKEMREVGNLKVNRLALQRLIDKTIENMPNASREDLLISIENQGNFSADELTYIDRLLNLRLTTGGWGFMDKAQEVASKKQEIKDILNKSIEAHRHTTFVYSMQKFLRGVENWFLDFGGTEGEDIASNLIDMQNSFRTTAKDYKYSYWQNASKFYRETESRSFKEFVKNLEKYGFNYKPESINKTLYSAMSQDYVESKSMGIFFKLLLPATRLSALEDARKMKDLVSEDKIDQILDMAEDKAKRSAFYKTLGDQSIYFYQRSALKAGLLNNADYFKNLYELRNGEKGVDPFNRWGIIDSLKENPFYFNTNTLNNKALGKFIKSKDFQGEYESRAIEQYELKILDTDNAEDLSNAEINKIGKFVRLADAYKEYKDNNIKKDFSEFLKEKGIQASFSKKELDLAKEVYSKYGDVFKMKSDLYKYILKGDVDNAKELLDILPLTAEETKKLSEEVTNPEIKEAILSMKAGKFIDQYSKLADSSPETAEKLKNFSLSIDKIKSTNIREKLKKFISEGDKEGYIDFLTKQAESGKITKSEANSLMEKYLGAISAAKDAGIDIKNIYKEGEVGLAVDANKTIKFLFKSLGIENMADKDKKKILSAWGKGDDAEALSLINKYKKEHNQSFITYEELQQFKRMSSVGSTLGFSDKDMKAFNAMENVGTDKKLDIIGVQLKKIKDYNKEAVDLLDSINKNIKD